jgi:predicted transposase YbfD/YdcC
LGETSGSFSTLPRPRVQRTRRHRLTDIVLLVLIGTICGCEGWDGIVWYAQEWEAELRTILELPGGIPSADTLRRVMGALDPRAFGKLFIAWTQAMCETTAGKLVAIDGKTVRGSFRGETGEGALHLVNAWVSENQMVLGQYATDVKSNELTAIPELLALLDLQGATVSIDAMGCQKGIAKQIVEKGADYIFGLKSNQPTLHKEVLDAFDAATCAALRRDGGSYCETVDKGHGRNEVRRVYVQREVGWLTRSDRWPKLSSLILVESERTRRGETSVERRAYISSLSVRADVLAARVRGHWHVENRLHWVLDVVFGEDRSRISRKNGAENLGIVRKIAMNLLRNAPTRTGRAASTPMKRISANARFEKLLRVLGRRRLYGCAQAEGPNPPRRVSMAASRSKSPSTAKASASSARPMTIAPSIAAAASLHSARATRKRWRRSLPSRAAPSVDCKYAPSSARRV